MVYLKELQRCLLKKHRASSYYKINYYLWTLNYNGFYMKKLFFIIISILFLSSCSNEVYKYYDYDNLLYAYSTTDFSEKEMKRFSRKYTKIVDSPKGKRKLPPPGACAEYGYLLYLQGKTVEAKEYLIKEAVIYPESQTYIDALIKTLEL